MNRIRRIRFDIARDILAVEPHLREDNVRTTFGELRNLVHRSEYLFVKPAAVELLAMRDHSRKELLGKLRRKGFSRHAAENAVDELNEMGYQDDLRAAESWVRSMMRGAGRSRTHLLAGLAERGYQRELAFRAVQSYEAENPGCFERSLQLHLEKTVRNVATGGGVTDGPDELTESQRKTVISRLMRRGFSTTEIQQHFH